MDVTLRVAGLPHRSLRFEGLHAGSSIADVVGCAVARACELEPSLRDVAGLPAVVVTKDRALHCLDANVDQLHAGTIQFSPVCTVVFRGSSQTLRMRCRADHSSWSVTAVDLSLRRVHTLRKEAAERLRVAPECVELRCAGATMLDTDLLAEYLGAEGVHGECVVAVARREGVIVTAHLVDDHNCAAALGSLMQGRAMPWAAVSVSVTVPSVDVTAADFLRSLKPRGTGSMIGIVAASALAQENVIPLLSPDSSLRHGLLPQQGTFAVAVVVDHHGLTSNDTNARAESITSSWMSGTVESVATSASGESSPARSVRGESGEDPTPAPHVSHRAHVPMRHIVRALLPEGCGTPEIADVVLPPGDLPVSVSDVLAMLVTQSHLKATDRVHVLHGRTVLGGFDDVRELVPAASRSAEAVVVLRVVAA